MQLENSPESAKALGAKWVSPTVSKTVHAKGDAFQNAFSGVPESSFDIDCGSSVISLDFGLVSPSKNWCSPPQRIERAQNKEWFSPHRVIDRPNPENSPGNWISMKESCCLTLRHSPSLGVQPHPEEGPSGPEPGPLPRPISQTTYVLPDTPKSEKSVQPTRKTCVLSDYEPERVAFAKNTTECNLLPSSSKTRRLIDSHGHVIKVSLLDDYEAPVFGKSHDKATGGGTEKENTEPTHKPIRGTTSKATKSSTRYSPLAVKPRAKKTKKEEGGTSRRNKPDDTIGAEVQETKAEVEKKEDGIGDEEAKITKNTNTVLKDLEEILRPLKEGKDKPEVKQNERKPRPKSFKKPPEVVEPPEKKKRNVDPKAVQEYIKHQKQKRMEQVKTAKKTKDAEREARKKKLEELRIRTLKLAAQSKKKKPPPPEINVEEPVTEDDITISLGLKQTKPKVSYIESITKLKKKGTQKIQPTQLESESPEPPEDGFEIIQPEEVDLSLKKPEDSIQTRTTEDLNLILKKLAEGLQQKLEKQKEQFQSRGVSSASVKDALSLVPSQETLRSVKSAPEQNRQLITVDLETIQTLKSDIKKISENFKVLHDIIVEKTDLSGTSRKQPSPVKSAPSCRQETKEVTNWFHSVGPRPYPYNVFTAFQQKMNLKPTKTSSSISQGSSTFAEPISNKYESEFEALSMPSDRLRSAKDVIGSLKSTSEENYFSMKEDSGSELSSSILDSEKQSYGSSYFKKTLSKRASSSESLSSSIVTEITSRSIHMTTSRPLESSNSKTSLSTKFGSSERDKLVTPDIKLISNDLHHEKLNNYNKNLCRIVEPEELNNSEKSYKEQKSDSTITEIIDNLSENDRSLRSLKSINEKPQNIVQRVEEVHVRRSFFQPEMLHLQFQAELTLLETFQQSLSHFLEAERMKTLSEVNKIVSEKAINTEKPIQKEDQAVQTSYLKESSDKTTSDETDSVKTEINILEEESAKAEEADLTSEVSEKLSISSKETIKVEETQQKDAETSDFSSNNTGISLQMLNRMMKDEELRSEHQLALIRLREKTLNEKVKAELTFLEMKKRALKEKGSDEEQNISAIKKKQRGILLKYQSEKEEIERLKKMHKIASEERKIMIKQQKQIQQMQMSTNDMLIKLKKRERYPQKKLPLKPKSLKSPESQSDIPEDIPIVSDSILSESICSAEESTRHSTDLDLSSRSNISEEDSEILRRNKMALQSKLSQSLENFKSKKYLLETEKYPRKRHSVEELLSWTKRLEEKENHLKELVNAAKKAQNKVTKLKISMKDRSTSPFQFHDSSKTEISPSEGTEVKKSSTISEAIESNPKSETTEKTTSIVEKLQSSASEDIPEQFSKKISTSRTTEYYSESFESPSSSEAPKTKPEITRVKSTSLDGSHRSIAIKLSLSPRMQSPRRRYSSGSDESVNLSHTETASEQSDLETRIAALHEQLRKRKLEAERLRREQKKAQRERLKVKEQSLLKQIQAYDAYIQKKKQELEQEYEHSHQNVMKPLIKQPKVAEMSSVKRQEPIILTEPKPAVKEEIPEKIESDSEVSEQIKTASESVKEVIEESESIKEQSIDAESSVKESTSVSESLPEQDASQSESEDQSISIKTTVYSPEKQDTERIDSKETIEDESLNKVSVDEEVYSYDSFESDFEEKTTENENVQNTPEISEAVTEIKEDDTQIEEESVEMENKSEKTEKIVDSIITGLILESLEVFCNKKAEAEKRLAEESKLTLEALSSYLAKEIISEAVDDILKIYNRKIPPEEDTISSSRISAEVRKRVSEIVSQSSGIKEQRRPQDIMITTYDVSPVTTPPGDTTDAAERERFLQSLNLALTKKKSEEETFPEGEDRNNQELKSETFGQEWIDDDFGLSRTRREAEELRLQQLQIEQEIQQLQAQQEQVPYFYLREIPNKPPPPYTPPGKPLIDIPTSESDIVAITSKAVRILTDEMGKGKQIGDIEPGWDYYGDAVSEHFKNYKLFLFDLAKHIITELIEQQEPKEEVLPWLRTREHLSKYKYKKIERTYECLSAFVQKQVLILFGFGKKVSKESLIVKWIKKKRDHVDEILVGESQEEEAQWTRYDEDQVTVKNEVTLAILDGLLDDTTQALKSVFNNKLAKEKLK